MNHLKSLIQHVVKHLIIVYGLSFNSNSFEESIKKILLFFGRNIDTNACIVGSIARALYGIDESLNRKS